MTVRDFPGRPVGAAADSPELLMWLDMLRNRQNIDDQIALTTAAAGDELLIFDVSSNTTKKITLSDLKTYILA